jgi:hypothetical protein
MDGLVGGDITMVVDTDTIEEDMEEAGLVVEDEEE